MKANLMWLLFGALFVFMYSVTSVNGRGGKMGAFMKKCKGEELNMEEAKKGMECFAEAKSDSRRKRSPEDDGEGKKGGHGGKWGKWKKPSTCKFVCQWKKTGVLDESGKYSESGLEAHMKKVYPEKLQADVVTKMKQCGTDHSSKFSMDNECAGYNDFKRCLFKTHMTVCGHKMGKWGGKGKGGGGGGKATPPPEDDEE